MQIANLRTAKKMWQDLLGLMRQMAHKLRGLYRECQAHADLHRLAVCCLVLLGIVSVINPFLGVACFLAGALYLCK